MYFKKIDIQGFKSFADPVSIEFHEGITCIVGPNGSGKSNISDAIRWVLGEQSAKQLRGGKMEEVIFAGTETHKSRGMAEVTLTIDNSSQILPIDYAEVAITRRMYRSGESGYFINNVACRLRDIRELIMDTGIGVDGYSLIGQGKISDILSDKPEARREIFEEAAGIVKYRSKKEETERKLASSKDNLDRVNDIIGEIESRIDNLREESIKAAEYVKLRERFKEVEINITLKNLESLDERNEKLKEDIDQTNLSIRESDNKKSQLQKELSRKEDRIYQIEENVDSKRAELLKLVGEINELANKGQLDHEKLAAFERDKLRLKNEIEASKEKLSREESNKDSISERRDTILAEYDEMKVLLDEAVRSLEIHEQNLANTNKYLEDQRDNIYENHRLLIERKSEIKNLVSLEEALENRKGQLSQQADFRANSHEQVSQEFIVLEENRNSIQKESEKIKEALKKAREAYEKDSQSLKNIRFDKDAKRMKSGQISARLKVIEEMEAAYEGYNEAVKFIMSSNQPGIHGAIADLIKVPEGYEKAIETALGPALQNIICQNDKDAKEAVAILKEKRVGRLTFLPLESIKSRAGTSAENFKNEKGFKGSGVDCIDFNEKFKGPMEYLLGRVVIVESLDDAVSMSKSSRAGGLRFVTLEGEIVNSSGAITGGAYRTKTAGLLERKSEITNLVKQIKSIGKELESLEITEKELQSTLQEKAEEGEALRAAEKEIELKLLAKENQINSLKGEILSIEEQKDREDNELATIEKEMSNSEKNKEEIKESITNLEESIEKWEKDLMQKQEEKTLLEKGLEEVRQRLTEKRLDFAGAENQLNGIKETINRIEEYIKEHKFEIEDKEASLELIKREEQKLKDGDEGREDLLESKETRKVELENEIQNLSNERSQLSVVLAEEREKRESLDGNIEGLQRSKHEMELRLARNETQSEGLKEKLWEDFEVSYVQAMEFRASEFVMSRAMRESRQIRERMRELGEVNIGSIKEYESVKERYDFLQEQKSDLTTAMDSLIEIIEDMDRNIRKSFTESFNQVVINFEKTFTSLFGGGQAELRLADENKPLETGIDIIVQPPGKKLQNLNLLSGGEKSLTAIALMFAILKTKPTPFCILDEVESALDETNIERFASYLRDFKEIQFALVTHQKATMEYADVLYGVTMPEGGISKVISLKLGEQWEA